MSKYSLIFLPFEFEIILFVVNSGVHAKQEAHRRKICIATLCVVLEVLLSSRVGLLFADKRELYSRHEHTLSVALRDISKGNSAR
jgi:hypothetical protein